MKTNTDLQLEVSQDFINFVKSKYGVSMSPTEQIVPEIANILYDESLSRDDKEDVLEAISERAAEPIKSLDEIRNLSNYFTSNGKLRDNLLLITGIHTGLRVYDLRHLRFCDLLNKDGTFKDEMVILEHKTRNARKQRRNRHIAINDAIKVALAEYLKYNQRNYFEYIFTSESNNGSNKGKPLARFSIQRILVNAATKVGIKSRVGTHTLRKTFGYYFINNTKGNNRALYMLQQAFGHSSDLITLRYIGLTKEEISGYYRELNYMIEVPALHSAIASA